MSNSTKVCGVILSGGRATRMDNQDKGLVEYKGRPLVSYAIAAMRPVVDQLIINANRNLDQYQLFNLPVVTDQTSSFDGPLAGISTAMCYTKAKVLLVMPCDLPLIRPEHLQKLLSTCIEQNTDIAVAYDGREIHPVLLAIKTSLQMDLQNYLDSGKRKVGLWLTHKKTLNVDFSTEPDIFTNINTIKELSALEGRFC